MRVCRNPGTAGCTPVIEKCTTNNASTPGNRAQSGNGPPAEASSLSASDREGSASRTPKRTRKPEVASRAAVTPKEALMPTRSAKTPPKNGPAAAAIKMNVWSMPSLEDARSCGAVAETSTVAAATVPVMDPCKSLSRSNCHGAVTRPIKASITVPASVARSSIFFCP